MSSPVCKKVLNPNNGLKYYSQFFEVVHAAHSYSFPRSDILNRLATILRTEVLEYCEDKNAEKIQFLTKQVELLADKNSF